MEERIEGLLAQLTLEEKVGMMSGIDNWHTMPVERLGIPAIKVTDGPHGARTIDDDDNARTIPATCFPTGSALAATWNPELIERVGEALGEETRARGCAVLLGPCVNIHRALLGGRNFESYSEDPYLSARMAAAIVKGIQSRRTAVSVKHFALNNQEFERMSISSEASERAMREIYFPSFEAAVKEGGAWTVMCSYNRINGTYAADNRWLLTDVLKEDWGFTGLVMSDWFAVHSTVEAASSGLDLEMPGPPLHFGEKLLEAVKSGLVKEEQIDDAVRRLLRLMERTGALDKPLEVDEEKLDIPEHRRLAREVAGEAITLLKNEGSLLPLDLSRVKSIAVIGPNAARAAVQGGGSAQVTPHYTVSPLEGLRDGCPERVSIYYETGCPNNVRSLPMDKDLYLSAPGSNQPGLRGEYYANNDFAGEPAMVRADGGIDFRWFGQNGPVGGDDFSVIWTGIFTPAEKGTYTYGLVTDGWARVFIGDTEVCGTWGSSRQGEVFAEAETLGSIDLEADRPYNVRIEYRREPDRQPLGRIIRVGCNPPLPADLVERMEAAASKADVAIVFAGLTHEYESEGFDRKTMELPAAQVELIRRTAAANAHTIVVLNNGSPVSLAEWIDDVPAVVEAWFPGQECGNAIADVLLGRVNPSGKLPDTFPVRYEDNPAYPNYPGSHGKVNYAEDIYIGYRHYDAKKVEPLFPFGHGLSYTSFEYRNLRVTPEVKKGEEVRVSIDVTNTGRRYGKEVVQVYVRDVQSSLSRPVKELKAFRKVGLQPGKTEMVTFTLDERALSFYDPAAGDWVAEPGSFEVLAGSSSREIRARASFELVD